MKILVCISNVPDTTTKIRFTSDNKSFDNTGVQWIINPWDELALSRAIEIKEAQPGDAESITVINVGNKDTEPTLRKALAIGADKGIRVNAEPLDAAYVAAQIAAVVKAQPVDLILCGIDSSDFNGGAVGGMLAEYLGWESVSSVSNLQISGSKVIMNREIDGGYETVHCPSPLVAIVQKGITIEPKIPSMRGIMAARTKPLEVIEPCSAASLTAHIQFSSPAPKAACRMIDPENVKELVNLLHNEAKII